jgi:hypothetical protein
VPSIDTEAFAADLKNGLADVGAVTVENDGTKVITCPAHNEAEEPRSFTFVDSLDQIRVGITIDHAAWHSMWAGWTLEKASIAMFSVHVEEAINTASDSATTLRLVKGGVVAE